MPRFTTARTTKTAAVAAALAASLALSACSADTMPNVTDNPLTDLVEMVPWAEDIADGATADELAARIDELRAALPSLNLPDVEVDDINAKLDELAADVRDNIDTSEIADRLRGIVDDIRNAMQ